jgi:serine/threonine protein kinase
MDNTLENGTILNGKFEIKKHINSGAFGIVYLVEDENKNKKAIKELFIEKYCSRKGKRVYIDCNQHDCRKFDELKEDMKDEVSIIQKMKSNKILEVYKWFEENDTLYLVMEYINGENLETILNNNDYMLEAFPENEIKKMLFDLCKTLSLIHKKGYVHRDIKPSNIMKDNNGNYRLIDFSTIKKIDTKINSMVGTKHYRPPEYDTINDKKFYKSSDIYSLGMTIYHILKGGNPPPDYIDRDEECIENRYQNSIESLMVSTENKKKIIDDDFKIIIKKMTDLNPKNRYKEMNELGKEIKCSIASVLWILAITCSLLTAGTAIYYNMHIQVQPPDSKIKVDNKKFNKNKQYAKGKHIINTTKDGYTEDVMEVDLFKNRQPITIVLQPKDYLLKISVKPNNANIFIDGKKYNRKLKYKAGKYTIQISHKGYISINTMLQVPQNKKFYAELKPISSPIKLSESKSSSSSMSFSEASKFCKDSILPTIEEFKLLNYKKDKCYWSSTSKNLKQYIYNGSKPYSNPEYDNDKCYVICISKSGGT